MKRKIINAAECDARFVSEQAFTGYDEITVHAATLITNDRAKELFDRYHVNVDCPNVISIPDGLDIRLKLINGKHEIGPEANGDGVYLHVNGRLTMQSGSLDAAKGYYRITVDGKALMPRSFSGQLSNLQVNGQCEYYPDGAAVLEKNTVVDDLFVMRAKSRSYYSTRSLVFLDTELDAERLVEAGISFTAKKIFIAKSIACKIASLLNEDAELLKVPDGSKFIDGDLELTAGAIKKHGSKLIVSGDVAINDEKALSELRYLYCGGTVKLNKKLEQAFEAIDSECADLRLIDPDTLYISDRPVVTLDAAMFANQSGGICITDCAVVNLSADISPNEIAKKLRLEDIAVVKCSKEQESAVSLIAEDVASINTCDTDDIGDFLGGLFGAREDDTVINAAEYTM